MAKEKVEKRDIDTNIGEDQSIIKAEKIDFTGEIFLRERVDEDTGEISHVVGITMDNPFADLLEGGRANENNLKLPLGFKANQGKARAQFNYKAKKMLADCEKIEFNGYAKRMKFYDLQSYKWVRYLGIFAYSPFEDGVVGLTIPRAEALGLFEMFAKERLLPPTR